MKAKNTRGRSKTNWKRVDGLPDSRIDVSEVPELGPEFFSRAFRWPGKKKQITLRLDPDVLTFFRKHGRGYQTTINTVLRKYMEARKARAI
ncbi:MAG TPA: BrnA antitoxin family protein [Terriglobales bacterium]|nr:BrnA antitoxin family protein [Terriglobales bacterium]